MANETSSTAYPWDTPDPGWYPDAPMADYLTWPVVGASHALLLTHHRRRTPAYLRWSLLHGQDEDEDTAARRLGTLAHTAILEPDALEERYVCEPDPDPERFTKADGTPSANPRATAAFKAAVAALEEDGRKVVTAADWRAATEMRDRVNGHRRAAQLMRADGPVEGSGVAVDPETGLLLKVRPDKLVSAVGGNVNIKTTRNASPGAFIHDVYKLGYYAAAAFYAIALEALGHPVRASILLAIETDGAKEVGVYDLDEGAMDAGEQVIRQALYAIADCVAADTWPGLSADIEPITLPHYAWGRIDQELEYA